MQLKRLQLVGFKTFADKTEIELSDGITAVVGPNGCGKSNIADALLWVMGEQNPRLLRGAESRDVIFSGTDRRKKLGMAEVRLTVDNSDGSLPIDFAEVAITRRIYRSGESQYLINGVTCRLKDIVELFLDTGVGKGAYSFVSQSEIDAVLSARAEDRRELFEEAAGIKKYRVKKREAVRRLEAAEGNLTRIRDIVQELERQRLPMEEQASQARRHLELTGRLQQIEVDLLVGDVQQADYELYAEKTSRDADEQAVRAIDSRMADLEREATTIGESLAEAERELDSARLSQQAALSAVERTESQMQLAREREMSSERTAESLDLELRDLSRRISDLAQQVETMHRRFDKSEAEETEGREKLLAVRSKLREVEDAYSKAVRVSEDRQHALRLAGEERARREADLFAIGSRLSDFETMRDRAAREQDALDQSLRAEREQFTEISERHGLIKARFAALDRERTERELRRHQAQECVRRAALVADASRQLFAERQSRLSTLSEMQESGEGFYQGVRAVLNAARDGSIRGSYAPVVDIMTVPEELRVAIEVALGGSAQDIVCDTEAEAKSAIEWLKQRRAGRATFLALPMLRPGAPVDGQSLQSIPGLIGAAADRVNAEPKYRPVIDLLLGRVVIAESMDAAMAGARQLKSGWSRIVTLDGELVTPGGALTGGSLGGRGAHLVGRKGEIDDLRAAIGPLRLQVEQDQASLIEARKSVDLAEVALIETNRSLAAVQAEVAGAEQELAADRQEVLRLELACQRAVAETERIVGVIAELAAKRVELERALQGGSDGDPNSDEAISRSAAETARLAAERDATRIEAVKLEVESGRAIEKRNAARRELQSIEALLEQTRSSHAAKQSQREMAGYLFADAHLQQRDLDARLAAAREQLVSTENHVAHWRVLRQERLNRSFDNANSNKECSRERGVKQQSLHDSELQIARMEVRLAQTVQRLIEEYGIDQEQALSRPQVTETPRETVNEVARLRREIRQMGHVNTGAVEEYERLTERHDFLAGQRADLEQARQSILATIAEIDDSTRGTFLETFNEVAEEFSRLFSRLFGGGTTKLVLTAPDDLLETGIEVIAQPPGKKPQHLSLLSGGERALTAVALLFSFLSVRPSPFVLLDEVDAPLDGSNVEKFVNLVRDFTERTQFLIITHNPTTMEAAPRWYGVTMREAGVSSILSYRVPQESIESEPDEVVVLTRA